MPQDNMQKRYSESIIQAFLNNQRYSDIAKECNLSVNTVRKYSKDETLQRILNERRTELVRSSVIKMQGALGKCVDTVLEVLNSKDTSAQIKLNACQILFAQCRQWTETADILERIRSIEQSLID